MRRLARWISDRLDGAATSRGCLPWLPYELSLGNEILRTVWPDSVDLETGAIKTGSSPFVTEPRAVAAGLFSRADFFNNQRAGRIHHPKRAARLGTPVRSRFCNDTVALPPADSDFNYIPLKHELIFCLECRLPSRIDLPTNSNRARWDALGIDISITSN